MGRWAWNVWSLKLTSLSRAPPWQRETQKKKANQEERLKKRQKGTRHKPPRKKHKSALIQDQQRRFGKREPWPPLCKKKTARRARELLLPWPVRVKSSTLSGVAERSNRSRRFLGSQAVSAALSCLVSTALNKMENGHLTAAIMATDRAPANADRHDTKRLHRSDISEGRDDGRGLEPLAPCLAAGER